MEIKTESTKTERTSPQPKDDAESSSGSSSHPPENSLSSTDESSPFLDSCSCGEDECMDCDYGLFTAMKARWSQKKKHTSEEERLKAFLFSEKRPEGDAKPSGIEEALEEVGTKFNSIFLNNYCPYSSDYCDCSSGCSNCDYGLHTYTMANKTKSKSKIKKLGVRSSKVFRSVKPLERKRRISKTFSRKRARKSESSKSKTLESCYSTSSSSCDSKSVAGCSKRDSKLYATKDQTLKNKKKKSTRNSTKSKILARIVRISKRRKRNIWKKKMAKFSESNFERKFSNVSNSCKCDFGCTNCGRYINMKRERLKNKSVTARATISSKAFSVTTESVEGKRSLKQKATSFTKRSLSCTSYESASSENDSYFSEDCSGTRLSRRKSA